MSTNAASVDSLSVEGSLYRPSLPSDWTRRPLYSLAKWVNGLAFRSIEFSSTGMPIIKIAEIKNGITEQTKFTNQEFDQSVRVSPGDMLFSWSGQPESSIDVFWWHGPEGWLNQHIFRVTIDPCVDERFFFYLLRYLNPNFVGIARNKQTTGLGHVTRKDLEEIEAGFPPLPEQQAIAHVLGTLDDKIELNRRMNRTLEEMARAIFRDWFMDFGPTRAKMEGQEPYLPPELWDLFPDELVDSELGEIPEGWQVSELGEIAAFPVRTVKPHDLSSETAYIGLDHMPRKSIALDEWEGAGKVTSNKLSFNRGEFLFGKLRPYFHKVGLAPTNGICSTDIVVVSPKKALWSSFVLMCISTDEFVSYTDQTSNGTKMPRTSWKTMGQYEVCIPPDSLTRAFQYTSQGLLNRIATNIHQSRVLKKQRDTLLPHILSAEVTAKEREKSHAL